MNISVAELKQRYALAETVQIIDVREELEFHTFNIGGINIPLGKLPRVLDELDYSTDTELVVICQRGIRSETARRILTEHGFSNVKNLTGGLLAWHKSNV